ncbi:MAG TPA: PKD domain-containing protein [Candidatus Bathyarchaeia archaeon]
MRPQSVFRDLFLIALVFASLSLVSPHNSHEGSSPLAAFTYEPCVACAVPGSAVFFNGNWSMSSSSIISYTWDFGDGSPPVKTNSSSVTHLYGGSTNQWIVALKIQDSAGQTDTTSQLVLFYAVPRFTFQPTNPGAGASVVFNASTSISYDSTNPIKGYEWSFGDGTIGSGVIVKHSYSAQGSYRILLTLITSSGNPSSSKTLTVGPATPVITYSVITDKDSYVLGETVHAKLNATNHGTQPIIFNFTDSCSGFQFEIYDSTGSLVFTNVPPPFAPCAQVFTTITIQPGQTVTVASLDWKQVNMQGKQVPSGPYTITGVLHYESPYQTTRLASKNINILSPDFQLTANPASLSISKTSSGVFTITVSSLNGFTGTVNLSATILPLVKHPPTLSPIVSVTLTSANPTGTTTLTVSTNRSTNAGTYTVTITGTSGTTTHSISATVTATNK